jgi:hypothetical protein
MSTIFLKYLNMGSCQHLSFVSAFMYSVFVHRQYPEGNALYVSRGRSKHDGNQTIEPEQLEDTRRGLEIVLHSVSYVGLYY